MRVSSFRPSRALAFAAGFLFSGLAVAASTKPGDPAQGLATYFDNGVYNLLSNVLGTAPGGEGYADYVRTEFFSVPRAETGDALTTRDRPVPITLHVEHYAPETDTRTYTYTVVSGPSHGSLSGAPPDLVYTPDKGFTGFDRLMFQVSDGSQVSEATPVRIKVTGSTTLFESGPVRPLALSSDGTRLYAVNTPDARLEIFDVSGATPKPIGSVPVGMEPVAVSLRNDDEAWVVNTLSDSVSIVDLSAPQPYVKRTLPVGDEPQDVVFAGPNRSRAFITTAHRGQNSPSDPQLFTPGVGRADVWVYDADAIDSAATAATPPLTILTLFGSAVYAAIYKSGNQTTVVGENN
jgi:sugar lactone lactonase YvrE